MPGRPIYVTIAYAIDRSEIGNKKVDASEK
jgi:hypothetical protein